jgi:hypothetical protein
MKRGLLAAGFVVGAAIGTVVGVIGYIGAVIRDADWHGSDGDPFEDDGSIEWIDPDTDDYYTGHDDGWDEGYTAGFEKAHEILTKGNRVFDALYEEGDPPF